MKSIINNAQQYTCCYDSIINLAIKYPQFVVYI